MMEEQTKLKLAVGIRYLIEEESISYHGKSRRALKKIIPVEIKVIEFSKSNTYVKIKYINNTQYDITYEWKETDKIAIIEQL
jgi:hypothetical protein